MNPVTGEGGRWVLGNPLATCPKCNAKAAVHYAQNGKAEVWHAATDCCDYARERELRFNAASREEDHRTREAHERAMGRKFSYDDAGRVSK